MAQLDLVDRLSAPPNIKTTSKEGSSEHFMTKRRHLPLNYVISCPGLTLVRISCSALARLQSCRSDVPVIAPAGM